jgi:hypothetical protein
MKEPGKSRPHAGKRPRKKTRALAAEAQPASAPARERFWRSPSANVIWALLTGLAIGFATGREVDSCAKREDLSAEPAGSASAHPVYKSVAEFPAGWTKDSDIKGDILAGLTPEQTALALQALNQRNCECGCPFGSVANCLAKDPNCPRSPVLGRLAVAEVKAGKDLDQILAAIDAKQAELGGGRGAPNAAPPEPTGPVYVALYDHSPRKGPKPAKVTVVEFSDFQ